MNPEPPIPFPFPFPFSRLVDYPVPAKPRDLRVIETKPFPQYLFRVLSEQRRR